MGCFWKKENHLYIITSDTDLLNLAENAIIESGDGYMKLQPIKKSLLLSPQKHTLLKDGQRFSSYCDFCHDRLVSITEGCTACSFDPMVEFGSFEDEKLISALRDEGFYEVDKKYFEKELEIEKQKRKKKI